MRGLLLALPVVLGLVACGQPPAYDLSQQPGRLELRALRPIAISVGDEPLVALAPEQRLHLLVHDGRLLLLEDQAEPRLLDAGVAWDLDFESRVLDDGARIELHPRPLPPDRLGLAPLALRIQRR